MADQEINTLALVLRRFDFGESSQIAHLLTPVDGRISVLAKGIKKPNGYLKGPFDLFQLAQVRFLRRRHGDLGIMQRFEPLTGFAGLRQSLPAVFSAFYLGQLFYQGSTEENGDPSLFKLLARALGVLEEQGDRAHAAIVLATELRFLELLGFGPSWEHCARCDQPAASGKILFLSTLRRLLLLGLSAAAGQADALGPGLAPTYSQLVAFWAPACTAAKA